MTINETATQTPCPRCEGCGQLANSDDREPWSYWLALPLQSALAITMGLVKPEPCDECGGTGKAATQPPRAPDRDPILEAALIAAGHTTLHGHRVAQMQAAIDAVTPAIRQQVAEEIATALAARRLEITPGRPGWEYLTEAIEITNRVGGAA